MCELFQECRRGNVLIGTLRLDKDIRFKRSKAIIKYTTGRCCSKNIFAASPPQPPLLFSFFSTLFGSFLPEVKRKSHLHQAKLWWAALSVQKTWGFDSSHSMVINYFSTVVGPSLPSLSLCLLLQWCWWLEATHDKCCPYYWSHWEKAQAALG